MSRVIPQLRQRPTRAAIPVTVGVVRAVTSNRNKPFDITRLTYDDDLMSISREPSEDQAGFVLVVKPKLEGLRIGSRKQTKLIIETDLNPSEKIEVLVHVFNAADQPEAQQK